RNIDASPSSYNSDVDSVERRGPGHCGEEAAAARKRSPPRRSVLYFLFASPILPMCQKVRIVEKPFPKPRICLPLGRQNSPFSYDRRRCPIAALNLVSLVLRGVAVRWDRANVGLRLGASYQDGAGTPEIPFSMRHPSQGNTREPFGKPADRLNPVMNVDD